MQNRKDNNDLCSTGILEKDRDQPAISIDDNPTSGKKSRAEKDGLARHSRILSELYDRYRDELTRYIQSKFGSGPPEPEDVVQGSFSKLASMSGLAKITNPRAYLYTVARHYIIDYHKRSLRAENYAKSLRQDNDRTEKLSPSTAEQVLISRERLETLINTLNKLPKKQQRLVLLNRFQGLTCQEIGKRENMQAKAVQKQIHRALAKCLNELDAVDEA